MEHRDHAWARTGIATLQRILLDDYIDSDTPAKKRMICEEVPRSESEVPQEALRLLLHKLELWENDERRNMSEFAMMRVTPPPFLTPTGEAEKPNEAATTKPKRRGKAPSKK